MLFASRVFYAFVVILPLAALAHPVKEVMVPGIPVAIEKTPEVDTQRRRALLRASLKSQPEITLVREATPYAPRQMSDQERAHLRRQLRQQ